MSELANDLIDAIASNNQEQMNSVFSAAMNSKINDNLQARKIELAQRIYSDTVADETETAESENGSEEV